MTIDEKALMTLSSGVYILGTHVNQKNSGCIIDTAMQVAFTPKIISISCSKNGYTQTQIQLSNAFSLSVLSENTDPTVIHNFGYETSRTFNKWETIPYFMQDNLPVFKNSISFLTANVKEKIEFESHIVFFGEVKNAQFLIQDIPMTYQYYRNQILTKCTKISSWKCKVCGYVYNGTTPFEELTNTYRCPICGVKKDMFVQCKEES